MRIFDDLDESGRQVCFHDTTHLSGQLNIEDGSFQKIEQRLHQCRPLLVAKHGPARVPDSLHVDSALFDLVL